MLIPWHYLMALFPLYNYFIVSRVQLPGEREEKGGCPFRNNLYQNELPIGVYIIQAELFLCPNSTAIIFKRGSAHCLTLPLLR